MWKYEYWWKANYSLHLCLLNFDEIEIEKLKATPRGRGLPHVNTIMRRGFPQEKEKNGRGLPQEKEKNGGDSCKRKRNVYGGDSCNWIMYMVGTPTRKGLGLQQIYGVANLISTHEEEENWHHTIKYTGKLDSGKVSMVGWDSEICIVAEMLHYTVYYTGRIDRVANRVLVWNCLNCIFAENWDYTVYHTDNPNRVFALEFQNVNLVEKLHYTVDHTGNLNRVQSPVFALEVWMGYTDRHTVCVNHVPDRVFV